MLALAQAAEVKIVYTKTDVQVFDDQGGFPLDLNNDGTPDFMFVGYCGHKGWASSVSVSSLWIAPDPTRSLEPLGIIFSVRCMLSS